MKNIKFIFVWKTKEKWLISGEEKYLKFLKKYCKSSVEITKSFDFQEIEKNKEKEWEKILEKIWEKDFLILLDLNGKIFSSEKFAEKIDETFLKNSKIIFAIWWAFWFSKKVLERADEKISFSKMTFSHQMIRVFLMEQIFRAFSILNWEKYHK